MFGALAAITACAVAAVFAAGVRGDAIVEFDGCVGEVVAAIERAGVADNTLLIVTSDNGCSPQAKFEELVPKGHNPSYVFRGHKADIYEGGHRIPFLVRWPGHVSAGTHSDQTTCLTDLLATAADILGGLVRRIPGCGIRPRSWRAASDPFRV